MKVNICNVVSIVILVLLGLFSIFVLGQIAYNSFICLCFVSVYVLTVIIMCKGLFARTEYDGDKSRD